MSNYLTPRQVVDKVALEELSKGSALICGAKPDKSELAVSFIVTAQARFEDGTTTPAISMEEWLFDCGSTAEALSWAARLQEKTLVL